VTRASTDDRGRTVVHVANASGGQTVITWAKHPIGDPATVEADRAHIVHEIGSIKTARRSVRVNHVKARERFEARGLAAITAVEPSSAKPTHVVRIYYTSQGDELLCFDAGPMSRAAADSLAHATRARTEVIDTRLWNPIPLPKGARLVVLPSQMHERGEAVMDAGDALEVAA